MYTSGQQYGGTVKGGAIMKVLFLQAVSDGDITSCSIWGWMHGLYWKNATQKANQKNKNKQTIKNKP